MTFKEAMVEAMTSRGMFPSQAQAIIELYISSNKSNPMMEMPTWDSCTNEYPDAIKNILWMGVKEFASKWIIKNLPEAWFRPMFEFSEEELNQLVEDKKKQRTLEVQGLMIFRFGRHHLNYTPVDVLDFIEKAASPNSDKELFKVYFENDKDLEKAKSLIATYSKTQPCELDIDKMDTRLFEYDPEEAYSINEIESE